MSETEILELDYSKNTLYIFTHEGSRAYVAFNLFQNKFTEITIPSYNNIDEKMDIVSYLNLIKNSKHPKYSEIKNISEAEELFFDYNIVEEPENNPLGLTYYHKSNFQKLLKQKIDQLNNLTEQKYIQYIKYIHHGRKVYADKKLAKKHRSYSLCFKCDKLKIYSKDNCEIAKELFDICVKHGITTPVFSCPNFVEKS